MKPCRVRETRKRVFPGLRAPVLIVLAFLLGGCGENGGGLLGRFLLKPGAIITERTPDPAYERLFP